MVVNVCTHGKSGRQEEKGQAHPEVGDQSANQKLWFLFPCSAKHAQHRTLATGSGPRALFGRDGGQRGKHAGDGQRRRRLQGCLRTMHGLKQPCTHMQAPSKHIQPVWYAAPVPHRQCRPRSGTVPAAVPCLLQSLPQSDSNVGAIHASMAQTYRIADGPAANVELDACKIWGDLATQEVDTGDHVLGLQCQDAPAAQVNIPCDQQRKQSTHVVNARPALILYMMFNLQGANNP